MKSRIIIAVDTYEWAFHSIARQIEKAYGDRYDIQIIDRIDREVTCDVALFFWWKSAARALPLVHADRLAVGMYDHWSIAQQPHEFAKLVPHVDCFFAGNEVIQTDLALRAPAKQIVLTEDGVDLELFTPQPFPEKFTVGWCGNGVYEKIGLGDLKGIEIIKEACRLAGVPLLIQDKQVSQLRQDEMPEQFYRRISCYVCASRVEGTPCPVLEALACGRCVVSTRVGVVPKISDVGSLRIVERTAEALAEGISHFNPGAMLVETRSDFMQAWDWKEKVKAFGPVLEGD